MSAYMHTYIYIYIYIHTCMYVYIYIDMKDCALARPLRWLRSPGPPLQSFGSGPNFQETWRRASGREAGYRGYMGSWLP